MTRAMSPRRRMRIWTAHGGVCHICGAKIDGGKERWDVDHVIPLELSGDDSDENLAPVHAACHKAKTHDDVKSIRKAERMRQRNLGIRRCRKSPIPGGRGSGWKRKLNGQIVRRGSD